MTDELDPITPAPAAPVAVVDTPPPPADPDEAQAIEVQGGKMVPLAALKAAREEAKAAKEAAGKAAALEAELNAVRPYKQFLDANPALVQQALQPPPKPVDPSADPELVELARSLDYVNADGTPNLERAAKHQQIIERQAHRIAQQMVAPVAQSHAQQMSNTNWANVAQSKLPNGQPIDTNILAEFWRHIPMDQTANPAVAALVRDLAMKAQWERSPLPNPPPPPNAPPVHTESLGRNPAPAVRMTSTERAVAEQRGMSEEKYQKLTQGFQPGRMNPLED